MGDVPYTVHLRGRFRDFADRPFPLKPLVQSGVSPIDCHIPYRKGKRLIKELAGKYSKLNLMYEDEAQQTKPLLARNNEDTLEDM